MAAGKCEIIEIPSSDDENENSHSTNIPVPNIHYRTFNSGEDDFVELLSLFGRRLKDEKLLKNLCKLHNDTSSNFKEKKSFRDFIKESIVKLHASESKEHATSLMESICQVYSLRHLPNSKNLTTTNNHHAESPSSCYKNNNIKCKTDLPPKNDTLKESCSGVDQSETCRTETTSSTASKSLSKSDKQVTSPAKVSAAVDSKRQTPISIGDSSRFNPKVRLDKKNIEDIAKRLKEGKTNPSTKLGKNNSEANHREGIEKEGKCPGNQVVISDDESTNCENAMPAAVKVFTKKSFTKKNRVRVLEKKLRMMEKQINGFAKAELSFRDMDSEESAYMQESRLKERYVRTWRNYCQLVGEDADELVAVQKKVKVTSSPFPEINRAVAKYVNRTGTFPNLFEIKQVCLQASTKYELDLKPNDLHHCAVDLFTEVGQKLQKNRQKTFRNNAGNILTDMVKLEDDPAKYDHELKRKLKCNRKIAKQKTDQVFSDFVRQQYEQEATGSGTGDSDDEDSDMSQLEALRQKNLIVNKKIKRQLINKNADQRSKKKRQKDKTVISVTVSSSQKDDDDDIILTTPKMDYTVKIDSPLPTPKSKKRKSKEQISSAMPPSSKYTLTPRAVNAPSASSAHTTSQRRNVSSDQPTSPQRRKVSSDQPTSPQRRKVSSDQPTSPQRRKVSSDQPTSPKNCTPSSKKELEKIHLRLMENTPLFAIGDKKDSQPVKKNNSEKSNELILISDDDED